jgi:hypothetical protein
VILKDEFKNENQNILVEIANKQGLVAKKI